MISVVFPAYNEEENVVELHRRIISALRNTNEEFEIIAIDNASTDGTYKELAKLSPIKIIRFASNIGQTAAIDAGIQNARGDIIVTLDADLQNDPDDIPRMLEKLKEGNDAVVGWRQNRHDTFGRKIFSGTANWLTRNVLGFHLHDYACALKMFKKEFIGGVRLYGEMHVFLAAILHHHGAKIVEMPVAHKNRAHGLSKHTIAHVVVPPARNHMTNAKVPNTRSGRDVPIKNFIVSKSETSLIPLTNVCFESPCARYL